MGKAGIVNSIGSCVCPSCGQPGAQVGLTKGGAPYTHCDSEECEGTKFWTHGPGGKAIKGKARKVLVALRSGTLKEGVDIEAIAKACGVELPAAPASKPAPKGDDKPAPAAKSGAFLL